MYEYKDRPNIRKINIASLINNLPFKIPCNQGNALCNDIKSRVIWK